MGAQGGVDGVDMDETKLVELITQEVLKALEWSPVVLVEGDPVDFRF